MTSENTTTPEHAPLDRHVQVQVERLIDEDRQRHTAEEIERLAREAAAQHADAPVQQYVPNLVYNEVKSKIVADKSSSRQHPAARGMTGPLGAREYRAHRPTNLGEPKTVRSRPPRRAGSRRMSLVVIRPFRRLRASTA
jgi:hypothetical protein